MESSEKIKPTFTVDGNWIDASTQKPDLLEGKDYSEVVWAVERFTHWKTKEIEHRLITACFACDTDGWHWTNTYGKVLDTEDCEWDDDYEIVAWQPVVLPDLQATSGDGIKNAPYEAIKNAVKHITELQQKRDTQPFREANAVMGERLTFIAQGLIDVLAIKPRF